MTETVQAVVRPVDPDNSRYEEADRVIAAPRARAAYLKAYRLHCLARWAGATGRPIKSEMRKAQQQYPEFVSKEIEFGRFCGSAQNGMSRRYFSARFAVTPYAIPEVD